MVGRTEKNEAWPKNEEKFKVTEISGDYFRLEAKVIAATRAKDSCVRGCIKTFFFLFVLVQMF